MGRAMNTDSYPYKCVVKIPFPTAKQAEIATQVMQVDEEVGNRARKSLRIDGQEPKRILVHFEAVDAKSLRVSISSFCDFLAVSLKCFQEFDEETETATAIAN